MLTVLNVIGTRPEAIKMAPVVAELRKHPDDIRCLVCATGQHREMLDQVLDLFAIRPDFDLDVMQSNQSLSRLTAALLTALDGVVENIRPDWILAQGDTTTVAVAGPVAFYRDIRFGHVEAGLRTHDRRRPFPEEINRRIADLVADLYFAPTQRARDALLAEGVPEAGIRVTGNTVIDALLDVASREYDFRAGPLSGLPLHKRLVLITAHRRESFGQPFRELCEAIRELALAFEGDGVHFVYPVHLNPHVRRPVTEILSGVNAISLIEPLDYFSLVQLMKRSTLILTDSGGIQEEAPSSGRADAGDARHDRAARGGRSGRRAAGGNEPPADRRRGRHPVARCGGVRRHDGQGQPVRGRQSSRKDRRGPAGKGPGVSLIMSLPLRKRVKVLRDWWAAPREAAIERRRDRRGPADDVPDLESAISAGADWLALRKTARARRTAEWRGTTAWSTAGARLIRRPAGTSCPRSSTWLAVRGRKDCASGPGGYWIGSH